MSDDKLDLTPLTRAIARLREGLERYQQDTSDTQIRDGLIQRFEFTYEISHKMLKRFLEATSASPTEFDDMSFPDLIRSGNERGLLLGDWPRWKTYRDMRAKTSHTYDEKIAVEVVVDAGLALVARLEDHIDLIAQRVEQVHQDLEDPLRGDRGREHGHLVARLGIAVVVAAVALARDHLQAERGAHRIGQREVSITTDAQMSIQLILAEVVETGAEHASRVGAQHPIEEALDKAHGKGTLLTATHLGNES